MGGNIISSGVTVNGNTITITISEVTGNVVIKVPTVSINTGGDTGTLSCTYARYRIYFLFQRQKK